MIKTLTLAAMAPLAGLVLIGSAVAQDHTIDGQAVPAEQMQAVQDWCDELQAQQGLTGTQEPESTMSEEQVEAVTGSEATGDSSFDVSAVTLEQCQAGGFTQAATEN